MNSEYKPSSLLGVQLYDEEKEMILVELQNWLGNRTAILDYDNDTIYLYNYPNSKNFKGKTLWVANTKKRKKEKSNIKSEMEKGLQPYMPNKYCNSEGYITDFSNEKIWTLQWGLDQNSIAVYYKGKIIAIMPEWSGMKDFHGYTLGTAHITPLAWPLASDNVQIERFSKEKKFLDSWTNSTWKSHQEKLLSVYKDLYLGETKYFAADGGKWPPLGIHYCKTSELEFIATVGMSQLPMPTLGMQYEDTKNYTNVEIAIICNRMEDSQPLIKYVSGQAKYPWYFGTHFDNGHTAPCKQLKEIGSNMSFMAITETATFLPKVSMPSFKGRKTRLLFMIPIYDSERHYAEKNSTLDLLKKLENISNPISIKRKKII